MYTQWPAGVSKELLVTASDVSKRLMLWRLLLEYINIIILRTFYGKLCACANSVYQAVFFGLGTRLDGYVLVPSPLRAHVYCVTVDPRKAAILRVGQRSRNRRAHAERGNEASYV